MDRLENHRRPAWAARPDRPILWYQPTGAEKYRVIYADLSVKDMTSDDVKKLPEGKPN